FYQTAGAVYHYYVAHSVLIFNDDEKPGNHITDKVLPAKTKCQPGYAGSRQQRRYSNPQLGQNHHAADSPNHHRKQAVENFDNRVFALALALDIAVPPGP